MDRIPLITTGDGLDAEARSAIDRIVQSRGEISRPFQVLLHTPEMALRVAELGHVVRFESHLPDADRELVTLATGRALGCSFVWESHLRSATVSGVAPATVAALEAGSGGLGERESVLVAFVDELCGSGTVSDETFAAAHALLDAHGTVELALTVAYYTMLARIMSACGAC